jgi:hypothetical protein
MNNPTKSPLDFDFPPSRSDSWPSFDALAKHEPRGGSIDHSAIVTDAANVRPVPGTNEATEYEHRRRILISANRAVDGQVVNEAAKDAIEGVALTGLVVVGTIFGAEVAVVAGLAALGVAIFGGRK